MKEKKTSEETTHIHAVVLCRRLLPDLPVFGQAGHADPL